MKSRLRSWEVSDIDRLVVIADNYEIAKNLTDKFPHPYTRESGEGFIAFARSHDPRAIMAIEVDGQLAGAVGLHLQEDIFQKNAELGYWLGEEYWGKGIMTIAVERIVEYGFETFDINRILARPFGSNVGSQKVLEKAGFTLEATLSKTIYKNGKYEDEHIYAIRKS